MHIDWQNLHFAAAPEAANEDSDGNGKGVKTGMILPFEPLNMSFSHMWYSVPMPKGTETPTQPAKEGGSIDRLYLLKVGLLFSTTNTQRYCDNLWGVIARTGTAKVLFICWCVRCCHAHGDNKAIGLRLHIVLDIGQTSVTATRPCDRVRAAPIALAC